MDWQNLLFLFGSGFVVKSVASLDGTIAKIPVVSYVTEKRIGELAFALGNILAATLTVILAYYMSSVFGDWIWFRYVIAGIILVSAAVTWFDLWPGSSPSRGKKLDFMKGYVSTDRFFKLLGAGFIISVLTLFDDFAALIPLYNDGVTSFLAVTAGVAISTILQIVLVIFFSAFLDRIPHRKEMASGGLAVYAILVMFGVV